MNYHEILTYGSNGKYGSAWDASSGTWTSLRMTIKNVGSIVTNAHLQDSADLGSWNDLHDFGSFTVAQTKFVKKYGELAQYWRVHGTTYNGSGNASIECWGTQIYDLKE